MRRHSPAHVQVKAAGGVRDLDRLLRVRELGCTRSGATATKEILDEAKRRLGRPDAPRGPNPSVMMPDDLRPGGRVSRSAQRPRLARPGRHAASSS